MAGADPYPPAHPAPGSRPFEAGQGQSSTCRRPTVEACHPGPARTSHDYAKRGVDRTRGATLRRVTERNLFLADTHPAPAPRGGGLLVMNTRLVVRSQLWKFWGMDFEAIVKAPLF